MTYTRIVPVALKMESDGLSRVHEEDAVAIRSRALETSDGEVLFSNHIRIFLFCRSIQCINFLT